MLWLPLSADIGVHPPTLYTSPHLNGEVECNLGIEREAKQLLRTAITKKSCGGTIEGVAVRTSSTTTFLFHPIRSSLGE